jgi:hypothetical protein
MHSYKAVDSFDGYTPVARLPDAEMMGDNSSEGDSHEHKS